MNAGGSRSAGVDNESNAGAARFADPSVYLFFSARLYRLFIGASRNRREHETRASPALRTFAMAPSTAPVHPPEPPPQAAPSRRAIPPHLAGQARLAPALDRIIAMTSLFRHFPHAAAAFPRAARGNVAIMFAFALVPILGLVGAAVDYSRANSARSAMQAALDATALMISKEAAGLSEAEIRTRAQDYFDALYDHSDATIAPLDIHYTPNSGNGATVEVNTSGSIGTAFMKVAGFRTIDFNSSASTTWGAARLRVALALDTTGSMADAGKMASLKTATKDMLAQLQSTESKPGDIYVSIIPFSKNVNLGPDNHTASWIDWTDWEAEPAVLKNAKPTGWSNIGPGSTCPFTAKDHGFTCTDRPATTQGAKAAKTVPETGYICPSEDSGRKNSIKIGIYYNGCYNSIPISTSTKTVSTGSSASCSGYTDCACTGSGRNKTCVQTITTYEHIWRPADKTNRPTAEDIAATPPRSTWNGCVTDRGASNAPSGDYDRKIDAPTSANTSKYPAEQNSYCSPAVMGLSNDWAGMKTQVDNLYPLGATNQPIGLVWGWQSLVGGGPLVSPPKEDNYKYIDAIVLMSDGLNTLNRWYGNGSSTNTSVDKRMYESATLGTCANIKAMKDPTTGNPAFMIYTIHVNTDGDPMSELLKNCASSPDKFWMITSGGELGTVFNQIATELSRLRLTK